MVWIYTLLSVLIVSLVSLLGAVGLYFSTKKLEKILIYLVSLAAGTLLGGAFLHLIPEAMDNVGDEALIYVLVGFLFFFVLEKIVHWRHCHKVACDAHPHAFSYVILVGDTIHNFIDGVVIAASFMMSIPLGVSTTIAVIFHEIPQEIGDFGSLIYAGFSKSKALLFNFLSALAAVLGAVIVLIIGNGFLEISKYMIPIAAGGFIYIAAVDLLPEMHKINEIKKSFKQLLVVVLGIIIMWLLLRI
ncbi:MAG: ZIP family metal transporter [Candidatus Moranbacteria bacterium]|nr:ZIP family metal transporter [Candidatus Moranbacteria bacterium]